MTSVDHSPSKTSANTTKTRTQGVQLIKLIIKSAKTAGILFVVWSVGFWKFSVSWVLGAVAIYVSTKEYKKVKARQKLISALLNNEEEHSLARVDELPSWVYFPDVERAEWFNQVIQQMWPFIGRYVEKVLRLSVQRIVDDVMPSQLKPFKFEDIYLGQMPPRIGGVKVYIDNVKRDEIVLDAELTYAGDADINLSVRGIHAGIKDIMINGTIRVIMRPIVNAVPIIGGLDICFLNQPNIDFDLTKMANILDMPLLSSSLRTVVSDQVATHLVLPSYIHISLGSQEFASAYSLSSICMPKAVVSITMVEADDLKKADVNLFGKGSSDPYCKITANGKSLKTKVIESTINPIWDETFEFIINNMDSEIEIEVFDRDPTKDDKIGNTYIRICDLVSKGSMDEWIRLGNVKTGRIHIRCSIFYLTFDKNDPNRVSMFKSFDTSMASAVLFISVDSAKNLPANKKSLTEPSPFVNLEVGNNKQQTTVCSKTTNPRWDKTFYFTVSDPNSQVVIAEVLDANKDNRRLGMVNIKLSKLMGDDDMMLCQPFALKDSSTDSTLTMRLCMRLLTTVAPLDLNKKLIVTSNDESIKQECNPSQNIGNPADKGIRFRGLPIKGFGEILLTIRYNQTKERLIVIIQQCKNLIAYDKDNFSDPYVRMYLLPDRSSASKRKTEVIKNNLNPVWEQSFEWPIKQNELKNRTLEVLVKNFIGVFEKKTKTEMGVLHLKLADFDDLSQPLEQWFALQDADAPSDLFDPSLHFD